MVLELSAWLFVTGAGCQRPKPTAPPAPAQKTTSNEARASRPNPDAPSGDRRKEDRFLVYPPTSGFKVETVPQFSHSREVTCLAFSVDGWRVVSGSEDGDAHLWDTEAGTLLGTLRHGKGIRAVAMSPNGWLVATGGEDQKVILWNAVSGERLHTLGGHTKTVTSLAFGPGPDRMVSGSDDGTARLWDTGTGQMLATYSGQSGRVTAIAVNPKKPEVLTGSSDGKARLYDAESGRLLQHYYSSKVSNLFNGSPPPVPPGVTSLAFSPDGQRFLAGMGFDGTEAMGAMFQSVRLWDKSSAKPVQSWNLEPQEPLIYPVRSVAFLGSNRILVNTRGRVAVYALSTEALGLPSIARPDLELHLDPFDHAVAELSTDKGSTDFTVTAFQSDLVASGDMEGGVHMRRLRKPQRLWSSPRLAEVVMASAYDEVSESLVTGALDGSLSNWDLSTGRLIHRSPSHSSPINSLAISRGGREYLSGSEDGTARLWDASRGVEVVTIKGADAKTTSVAFAPGGRIATGGSDNTVRLWDASDGKPAGNLVGSQQEVLSLASVTTPPLLLVGSGCRFISLDSGTAAVEIFDPARRERLAFWTQVSLKGATGLVISPDGTRVVTLGARTDAIRDSSTGSLVAEYPGVGLFSALGAGFNQDASRFFVASRMDFGPVRTGTVEVFETKTGHKVSETPELPLNDAAMSRRGGAIVVGLRKPEQNEDQHTLRIYDATNGKLRFAFEYYEPVNLVDISEDGSLVASAGTDIRLWDARSRQCLKVLPQEGGAAIVMLGTENSLVLTMNRDGRVLIRRTADGSTFSKFDIGLITSRVELDDKRRRLISGTLDGRVIIRDLDSGRVTGEFNANYREIRSTTIDDSGRIAVLSVQPYFQMDCPGFVQAWGLGLQEPRRFVPQTGRVVALAVANQAGLVVGGNELGDGAVRVWKLHTGEVVRTLKPARKATAVAVTTDGSLVAAAGADGVAQVWGSQEDDPRIFRGHASQINGMAIHRSKFLITSSQDATTRIWDLHDSKELCRLITLRNGSWVTIAPDGRYDTGDLEHLPGVMMAATDQPYRSLPLDVFMRDYYQPRLLTRLLDGEALPKVRNLIDLKRTQPVIEQLRVTPGLTASDAKVEVSVAEGSDRFLNGSKYEVKTSQAYDVRLFRDGQLVGRWPEPAASDDAKPEPDPTKPEDMAAWRATNRVVLEAHGKARKIFPVRLPHEPGRTIEFTAYAFNEDRVKSANGSASHEVPRNVSPALPRAYLVAFGVAGFSDPDWDLRYSAADARLVATELGKALSEAGHFEVVPVLLATDRGAAGRPPRPDEAAATAANLKAVLDALAGRQTDARALAAIANARSLTAATPDDLVVLFASTHGYTDTQGAYYIFPQDIGKPRRLGRVVTPDLLDACVSSGELSAWLRDVDAGQFALIVDCCHAASTVEQPGFKPGPMGSRGLGQLAYDKAMRVLAASQADDVALEALVKGEGHGLLTYALVREGLMGKRRVKGGQPRTLGALLKYAEGRVPDLYSEVFKAAENSKGDTSEGTAVLVERGGDLVPLGGNAAPAESTLRKKGSFQTPSLFDYARQRDAELGGKE
jgi:WD40 repeat protein